MTESMTLYGAPMTCSMAVHAALRDLGLDFDVTWVSRGPGRRVADAGYGEVNPKRKVPSLVVGGGETLTEIVGVLAHLDAAHGPTRDAATRRRLIEWLSLVATELHQAVLGPVFDPESPAEAKADAVERLLPPVLAHVEGELGSRAFVLAGEAPSVADFYLGWALALVRFGAREAVGSPALLAYLERVMAHPPFAEALAIERARFSRSKAKAKAKAKANAREQAGASVAS